MFANKLYLIVFFIKKNFINASLNLKYIYIYKFKKRKTLAP